MDDLAIDVGIIGGGVIGLAIARQLAHDLPTRHIAVFEKEKKCGTGISSRNSEVIHAGLYYPKSYLKTTSCVSGNRLLYEYCTTHGVAHRRLGKIIVANTDAEHEFLHALALRAEFNGVTDISWLTKTTLAKLEPAVQAKGAILSPSTGILNVEQFLQSLEKNVRESGVPIVVNTTVNTIVPETSGFSLTCEASDKRQTPYTCRAHTVINSAGLHAITLAKSIVGFPHTLLPRMALAKGDYFSYNGNNPFQHLIYPVPSGQPMSSPNVQHSGLGIHATLDMQNNLRFGPDLTVIDTENYRVDAAKRALYASTIQRYFPALEAEKLQPAYAGIRPRLLMDSSAPADFLMQTEQQHALPGLIQLFGIESPGLTSCLSLAQTVSEHLQNILR